MVAVRRMCTKDDRGRRGVDACEGLPLLTGAEGDEAERARLLDTALRLVAQRGYADATCGEGIRLAGVSSADAHRHFGDKLECFLAAYDAVAEALLDGARQVGREHGDWPGRVHAVLGYLLHRLAALPDVARACVVELPQAGREALARQDQTFARLAPLLRPPAGWGGAMPAPVVDQLLVGGVWDVIRTTIERDGPAQLGALRGELAAWVLRIGGGAGSDGALER